MLNLKMKQAENSMKKHANLLISAIEETGATPKKSPKSAQFREMYADIEAALKLYSYEEVRLGLAKNGLDLTQQLFTTMLARERASRAAAMGAVKRPRGRPKAMPPASGRSESAPPSRGAVGILKLIEDDQ